MNISAIVGTQHINWNRNRNHLLCTPNCYRFCYLTTPFRSGKKMRNMLKIYKILKVFATHWASIARKGWRVRRYTVYSIQLICSLYELWDVTKCSSSKGCRETRHHSGKMDEQNVHPYPKRKRWRHETWGTNRSPSKKTKEKCYRTRVIKVRSASCRATRWGSSWSV